MQVTKIIAATLPVVLGVIVVGCGTPAVHPDGAPPGPTCDGQVGDFHGVPFTSGGETRYYFLHVPSTYDCGTAWSLVVDFHGTGAGAPTDPVEESWAFDEMIEASDSEHFIVVRPRSRYANVNGTNIFQWDINAGDPATNLTFAEELISDLESRYHIDDQRVYAAGFSNGPSQALQFLTVDPAIVHGYMIVNGGLNATLTRATQLPADTGRVYVTVGFRDYMWSTTRRMVDFLDSHGHAPNQLWRRESNTGHELYGWHYHEAFRWMDRGERPGDGTLADGWSRDPGFSGTESLIDIARDPAGRINVVGEGAIYRRDAIGNWTRTAQLSGSAIPPHLNSLCFFGDGQGIAVGEGAVYKTADGASWTEDTDVPEFGAPSFGFSFLNGVACTGQSVIAGGVWAAATSGDAGVSWAPLTMPNDGGGTAFVTTVRRSTTGTLMAAGYYDYLGRSTDGAMFAEPQPPVEIQWFNDVETGGGGAWWAVGEKGTIAHSADDGVTWTAQPAPTTEDLYAVGFSDPLKGMAVGAHGAALLTVNGGATWRVVSTGLDGYLGAVTWIDAATALVVGEAGTVLTFASP